MFGLSKIATIRAALVGVSALIVSMLGASALSGAYAFSGAYTEAGGGMLPSLLFGAVCGTVAVHVFIFWMESDGSFVACGDS